MKIGEVAEIAGLSVKTVRYYDEIGLVSPDERTPNGYRRYARPDLAKLVSVRRTRAFGFSIDQTRELLSLYEGKDRTAADVKRIAQKRLTQIKSRSREPKRLGTELDRLVVSGEGEDRPDCLILSGLSGIPG